MYNAVAVLTLFVQEYSSLDFHALLTLPYCEIKIICHPSFEKMVPLKQDSTVWERRGHPTLDFVLQREHHNFYQKKP